MFKKILIANRGEIACRIMQTARKMGIKTVAICSEADTRALHVEMADETVLIGPAAAAESYLDIKKVLAAIEKTGADAVHPGYGFLSENAGFAKALKKAGVAFIGPAQRAITVMGDKIESKRLAVKAGVNTVPGDGDAVKDAAEAVRIAKKIGYPVMLKASAGGGGKGMRIARNDAECRDGLKRAQGEAATAFGDDRVFVEKYIESPRHIEIQILADAAGNTVYLHERECSIQRRHQKVIEEAPSAFLDEATRRAMGEQAVKLAKAVKYQSAGTVEFIVDGDRNFYFLEMNTRLQVEHPVTEKITGLDLVEWMIRIAAGETLPFGQEDIPLQGWSIEARVYAEDPLRNFLPSSGRLTHYIPPAEDETLRVDTGVSEGGEISIHYDPMIAKVVSYGATREEASKRMSSALDEFYIRGVSHNIGFLAALMAHPRFAEGRISTDFIAEEYPDGFHAKDLAPENPDLLVAVSAAVHRAYQERASMISGQIPGRQRVVADDWVVLLQGGSYPVHVVMAEGGYRITMKGNTLVLESAWKLGEPLFWGRLDGTPFCLQVERAFIAYRLTHGGAETDALVMNPGAADLQALMLEKMPPDTSKTLLSPMPGLLVSVAVAEGQDIKSGDELAVVEAMKMENVLRAERDGTVSAIKAVPGDSLSVDQVILEFE
ncbi:MAG: acetyl/propionyl/methylcrotonyl-CoA carboxylase subunit alpha [Alphaproteobacteria bacterium]|nr:acetyl/propionyl/methylcrotonyl-CoA carboxylase subunit alpha [Alphaproteobacteria bacterium]